MSSSSWEMQLLETAKEELQILQTQYPNRFAFLKSDLEFFISDLRQDHAPSCPSSSSSVVLTQESSNCKTKQKHKKRKYVMDNSRDQASSSSSTSSSTGNIEKNSNKKRKSRVEMVLERAQLCLQKIRDVKASLR